MSNMWRDRAVACSSTSASVAAGLMESSSLMLSWTENIVPSPTALALLSVLLQALKDQLLDILKVTGRNLPSLA